MTIFLEIVLFLVLVVVVLLSFPVRFHLLLSDTKTTGELQFFFRKITIDFRKKSKPLKASEPEEKPDELVQAKPEKKKAKVKKVPKADFPWFRFWLSERSTVLYLLKHVFRIIGRLLRLPRWELLRFHWQIGGDDPALIGFLSGQCWAVLPLVPSRFELSFEPDFVEGRWGWEAEVKVYIVPLFVVGWFCLELVRFPWLRIFGVWWRQKHFHPVETPEFA